MLKRISIHSFLVDLISGASLLVCSGYGVEHTNNKANNNNNQQYYIGQFVLLTSHGGGGLFSVVRLLWIMEKSYKCSII